jgi:hypothetical protein
MTDAHRGTVRTFTLGYLPDSYNVTKGAHWAKAQRSKKRLQGDMESMLMGLLIPRPLPGPVFAFAELGRETLLCASCAREWPEIYASALDHPPGESEIAA